MITSLLIPYFVAAIAARHEPALAGQPFIITTPTSAAERVLAVSPEAARLGLTVGMSLRQAHLRCPQVQLIPARPEQDKQSRAEILELLLAFAPRIEPASHQDHLLVYADFELQTGPAQLALAGEVSQAIQQQTHLRPALGLAAGKFPAYLAATAIGLNRALWITPGQERSFLAPFPIQRLPLDQELARRLQLLGLKTMGQFAALPGGAVLTQFGPQGRQLHQLARGLDERPLQPWSPEASAQLTQAFDSPVIERIGLGTCGRQLLAKLADRLKAHGQVARTLQLRLHLDNDAVWSDQIRLRQPTADPARLFPLLEALLERVQIECGVMALTLRLTGLTPRQGEQLRLFDEPPTLDRSAWWPAVIGRFGPDRFFQPELLDPTASLPEARFRLQELAGE